MQISLYDTICNIINKLNNLLWGYGTVFLVFGAGIFFTIRIKFYNIIHIVHIVKTAITGNRNTTKGNISHFQALSTALAASMGTGNIIGVAAAISMGGPGAIFWMWISAIFGTATGMIENILGTKYQNFHGGPMSYISKGAGFPRLAVLYGVLCTAASFGIGNMTQANALSAAMSEFGISPLLTGLITAALCGAIIFGGGKKVASAAEKLIPAVSLLYLSGAVIVIVLFGNNIINILKLIFSSAIGYSQIAGGICGAVLKKSITTGLRRGIFSNEAGMGSSVLVHTETDSSDPLHAGMLAVTEIVIDTLICCTATAFVILLTGADASGTEGLAMVTAAFRHGIGNFAGIFIPVCTVIFAFCTLLGWYFYGEKCVIYVFKNGNSKAAIFTYKLLYTAAAFAGACAELTLVWNTADLLNWFMLIINLVTILLLNGEAVEIVRNYTKGINRIKKSRIKCHFVKRNNFTK